jgi:CubicO group peptidase (beta-lactamase class C family)
MRCVRETLLLTAFHAIQSFAGGDLSAVQAPWPTNGWTVATPQARGLDPEPLAQLHRDIQAGGFGYIDRMIVVRDGYLITNERYPRDYRTIGRGQDSASHQYNYTHPDWHPFFQGRDIHTLQSVTKSVTSALIGIAIGRGEIAGTDAKLLSFLGDYDLSRVDQRLHDATLDDLLTMRSGIEWHESDRPLNDTNTTIQLEKSQDWVHFTLDQPMDARPGEKWVYNSGGSHLMSAIIRKATGRFVDEYAEEHLFRPLGIRDFHWKRTPTRLPDTEGGLYLEAEQLAKIGWLYLNDGVWNGRRILPEGWVAASTARRVELANAGGRGYGYQWWRVDRGGADIWAGLGFGGQFLVVIPQHRIVGVINSWNVFGNQARGILIPFIDALLASGAIRN